MVGSDSVPTRDGQSAMTRRRGTITKLAPLAGSIVGLLGVAFVVRLIIAEWPETRSALSHARLTPIVAGLLLGVAGMSWIGWQWRAVLRSIGGPDVAIRRLMRSYFIGQLGKYVPGGVWPVLGRAELMVRADVPRRSAYPSVGLSMATTYVAAVLSALIAAPVALRETNGRYAWVLLPVVPLGLVALHPRVLNRIVLIAERVLSGGQSFRAPSARTVLALVIRHVPAWMFISTATWCVARALQLDAPFTTIAFATPLAWAAGLVAVPVPGGIGVREAAFVALTAGSVESAAAATIAITARLLFITVDLICAAAVALSSPTAGKRASVVLPHSDSG
jgi:uncharacterized membrane protein YbhN (UPF0104 family)